ncbi:DUF397 domain-containing protein [Streptomyces sp. NPDC057340]
MSSARQSVFDRDPAPVIRDSKYRDAGPRLALPAEAWAGFVAYARGS